MTSKDNLNPEPTQLDNVSGKTTTWVRVNTDREWGCWRHATFSTDYIPWQCAKCGRTMRPLEDIQLQLRIRRRLRGILERIKGWKAKAHQALSDLTNKEN